jgi:SOS-response transcriptional repressor LexA
MRRLLKAGLWITKELCMELTKREQKALAFIEQYQQDNGDHPTYREIQDYMGWKSINSVSMMLRALEEKGKVFTPRKQKYRLTKFL